MWESTSSWTRAAARQHGAISLGQLTDSGVSERTRRSLLARGVLRRVAPRVFAVEGSPSTIEQYQYVGLLSLGPDAVLSHEAAARLLGFDRAVPDVVEFTVVRRRRNATPPFRVHSSLIMPAIDRTIVAGFPCTSATRTVIDLAGMHINRLRLEAALDSAIRAGQSSPALMLERLDALRGHGRRGVRRLDVLLLDVGGHTMLERRFLTILREAGLPRPIPQVVQRRDGRAFARVDFLFEAHRIVVEVSGRKGHTSPAERARDAERRNELQDAGLEVYEYTWEDVTHRPWYVVRTMRERLARAEAARPAIANRPSVS